MKHLAIALPIAMLAMGACAAGPAEDDETDPPPSARLTPPSEPTGSPSGALGQAQLTDLVEQAAVDLGLAPAEIHVVSAEAVTWSDGSLGCPQPGMAYTQALVPGFRVILEAGGEELHYHAGRDGTFFACKNPQDPAGDSVDR